MAGFFVGIKVPQDIATQVLGLMPIAETKDLVKWHTPENMHSTLQFYGRTPPEDSEEEFVENIQDKWSGFAECFEPFGIAMTPGYMYNDYYCAGLTGDMHSWSRLAHGTAPHVTLGQRRDGAIWMPSLAEQRMRLTLSASWIVDRVHLYRSANQEFTVIDTFYLG